MVIATIFYSMNAGIFENMHLQGVFFIIFMEGCRSGDLLNVTSNELFVYL